MEAERVPDTTSGVILVVDDELAMRESLGMSLEHLGYRVVLAEDGLRALDILKTSTVDMVLLDVRMPGLSGTEILERRRRNPYLRELPFVVISALDDLNSVVRCIELGADDYLAKPFELAILEARVAACLEKKR